MLRRLFLFSLLFVFGLLSTVQASDKIKEPTVRDQLDAFAMIADSWWAEQRCQTLALPEKGEFEWRVGQISQALRANLDPSLIVQVQQVAKVEASKRDCDEPTANLIEASLYISRPLHTDLDPENGANNDGWHLHFFNQLFLTAGMSGLAKRCEVFQDHQQKAMAKQLASISSVFAELLEKPQLLDVINQAVAKGVDGTKPACSEDLNQKLQATPERLSALNRIFAE